MSDYGVHLLGQYIPIQYHYQMLSDNIRMTNFRRAISMNVKAGQKVVDLGSGTGALSFFAAEEGAFVTGIENNKQLADFSKLLIEDNKMKDRIEIIQADATEWMSDTPVDVVICEMLHSVLLREKQVQVIRAFKDAHNKKFGTIPKFIPYATLLAAQPIYMNYNFHGFVAPIPFFQDPYSSEINQSPFMPKVFKTVIYEDEEDGIIDADLTFVVEEAITINALRFTTKSLLCMNCITKDTAEWFNQYLVLPMGMTLELKQGQSLRIRFTYNAGDEIDVLQKSLSIEVI